MYDIPVDVPFDVPYNGMGYPTIAPGISHRISMREEAKNGRLVSPGMPWDIP